MATTESILFAIQRWQSNLVETKSISITIQQDRMNLTDVSEFSYHLVRALLFVFFFLPHHLGFFFFVL
jgi:hypothetical protein